MCTPGFVQNPMGSTRDVDSPDLGGTVQVSPTVVDVSARPGAPVEFDLIVEPARNFPVDIYLLMDLSFSMRDDLDNLKGLGAQLATAITNISQNFQVGFGSFVDKRISPFVSLDTTLQDNPCPNVAEFQPEGCRSTYSFRHHVSLTDNETFFNEQVQAQTISGNQDSPEGGFDGFLQSMVCRDVIGWRTVSRKLLLYITDAGFHIAGDGKLGGVVLPHDGTCSTSPPDDYRDWITLDYPSIGQIAELLRENDIIPIFAAQQRVIGAYRALVRELGEGTAFVDELESDSRNIVSLVEDSYNNVSQRITFDRDSVPPGVAVDIQPIRCPGEVVAGVCTGVEIENNATFNVRVTLENCNAQSNGTIQVPIRVVGFGTFTINLQPICTCPCEDPANTTANHPNCNSNGTLVCGRCDCNPGRFGELCQCDATGQQGMGMQCPLGPTELQCTSSDRGTCVCGECQCRTDSDGNTLYFGRACECDRDGCPSANGELCSGRGQCTCDGCRCNLEPVTGIPYYGDACECTNNTNGCRDQRNGTDLCNGRGTCGCNGRCECPFPYLGDFCEDCSGSEICSDLFCGPNIPCAACAVTLLETDFPMAFDNVTGYFLDTSNLVGFPDGSSLFADPQNNGSYQVRLPSGHCPAQCMPQVVIISGTDDVDYMIQNEMALRCEYVSPASGCTHRYYVGILEETLQFTDVHVEARRFCPTPVAQTAPWIIAVAIIAALLILGVIALLLLKLFLFIFDVIEVRRFEKELAKTKYSKNTNPLYRSAAKDYMNPIYGQ